MLHDAMGGVEACRGTGTTNTAAMIDAPRSGGRSRTGTGRGVSQASGGKADNKNAEPSGAGAIGPCARRDARKQRQREYRQREEQPAEECDRRHAEENADEDHGGGSIKSIDAPPPPRCTGGIGVASEHERTPSPPFMAACSPLRRRRGRFRGRWRLRRRHILQPGRTESVPSPARKMTTVAIRVVREAEGRRRERSGRTSTWLLRERRSIPR